MVSDTMTTEPPVRRLGNNHKLLIGLFASSLLWISQSTSFTLSTMESVTSMFETSGEEVNARRRMNVVVFFPDDWRHDTIGGENSLIKTPFLDSLAEHGIRFSQNAVTTSVCWQSRATLFSGQWASRHQSYKLICPHFMKGENWNTTWPAILQEDGYHVGHVGKWQYFSDTTGLFDFQRMFEGRHHVEVKFKPVAAEDHARDETIKFLNRRPKDKPFAVTVAFYPPKAVGDGEEPGEQWTPKPNARALYDNITVPELPYNYTEAHKLLPQFLRLYTSAANQRWRKRFRTPTHYQEAMKRIYALITQVDQACKQIVDELRRQDLLNNTMIIFTTDNGMFHGAHGLAGKWYPYQESIRTPLIVYDPRMPAEKWGTVDESFTLNVDLASTILGAAGLQPHERMQGRDISDLYLPKRRNGKTSLERKPWRDEFFYEFTYLEERYIPSSNALVRKRWKFIDWYTFNRFQLFDLEKDPLELNDVVDDPANADIVSEMKERLMEIRDSMKEPSKGCNRKYDYMATAPKDCELFLFSKNTSAPMKWKLVDYIRRQNETQLFRLDRDPFELSDVGYKNPETENVVNEMKKHLVGIRNGTIEPSKGCKRDSDYFVYAPNVFQRNQDGVFFLNLTRTF